MKKLRIISPIAVFVLLVAGFGIAGAAEKENGKRKALDPHGVDRLMARTGGQARVSISEATGAARFVGLRANFHGDLMAESTAGPRQKARAFMQEYTRMLGLSGDVTLVGERVDKLGIRHLTFEQSYRGVPVFAGMVRAHFEGDGRLVTVNGNLIPGIRVSPNPTRSAAEAAATAIALVSGENEGREVYARSGILMVYRTGLAQGIDGESYLTWQIEVGNGSDIREFLFVDAHSGKVVDRLPGIMDAMFRRAYDGLFLPNVPPSYPGSPFWVEGDPFPTGVTEADNMLLASQETYDFFDNAFSRDSFDDAGAMMDSIFNRGYSCPNASWNGTFISFCNGLTTDDVTGHEWGHAYTQYTHNLIYAWQPGALNESYSDIWGETVDKINGRGTDTPDIARLADECSVFGGTPPPTLTITGGPAAGSYLSRASVNEPPRPFTIGPTPMAIVATAAPFQPTGACGAVSGVSGMVAIVDWTLTPSGGNECGSITRAVNAFNAGATGMIFVAPASGLLNLAASALIGSVEVTFADGNAIKAGLPADATISLGVGTDPSVRWLVGEDDTAVGLSGPLRDMWNPRCFGNPGKVSDSFEYVCSTADGGGVHTNSGIPNHAFSLIVDGGTYNGQTITGIGLTKAAHIYYRAASVYQHSASNFADHADAIEQSAVDLIGVNLASLTTGAPSGEIITAADVTQVEKAMLAVEMRTPPTFCNFQPLLAQNPPALCTAGSPSQIFKDNFDTGNAWMDHWTMSHEGTTPDFTERDWSVVGDLPDDRAGRALFGPNPDIGTCAPGGDETAVLHADSKQITIPNSVVNPRLTFMHWVATEAGWDGGNVKISVNGGPWTVIPGSAFIYNDYNATLFTAAEGNTNPIAGQEAFTGTDGGAVDGTWGRSIIDLTGIATGKDKIRLRFDIGNDGCTGRFGWYIDDLLVYKCH